MHIFPYCRAQDAISVQVKKKPFIMKSPFTGGDAFLRQESSELIFRKEKFRYVRLFYECADTGEQFTTTDIDEVNLSQVYNQYRVKYGIPFPDEIKQVRQMYGLSATKMSEILGFGENQYRLYENGDMPSEANGKILSSIKEPAVFLAFVENARNQFKDSDFDKMQEKIRRAVENRRLETAEPFIFGGCERGAGNGYAVQSCAKLKNVILYFLDRCGRTFVTKMNKLLFYTDFLSYKTCGRAMTGLAYKAIKHGPVPVRWDRVYSMTDDICQEEVCFPSGNFGIRLYSVLPPDESSFTEHECRVLEAVVSAFKDMSAADISQISNEEDAWKHYIESNDVIDFSEAFALKGCSIGNE